MYQNLCWLAISSLMLLLVSCNKDDTFCIEGINIKDSVTTGNASFTLPNGQTYSGLGAPPAQTVFGDYTGGFQSVVTKQTPTATGQDVELVHFFDDGKGNTFWTNDKATFTPLDTTFTLFQVNNVMTIVGGTGDFACASGQLINQGPVNFVTNTLERNLSGRICGGCD